ncbi:unnamed protein product [Linum tenue]|uniref:Uncharacterized protein n=1 Tax=Linum tenue TaxID=586396 RepID=A0AAV0KNQ6_9ROSI|nr:unnamed protein product [Linum tenue]
MTAPLFRSLSWRLVGLSLLMPMVR